MTPDVIRTADMANYTEAQTDQHRCEVQSVCGELISPSLGADVLFVHPSCIFDFKSVSSR